MEIRLAKISDIEAINAIYASARKFMVQNGNPNQWKNGYPTENAILGDIMEKKLYLCEENGMPLAVFYYSEGPDPTYAVIEDGAWLNTRPYGVIHRIAVSDLARGRGISRICFDFALQRCGNLKIDTHRDNLPMQAALEKYGFLRCGTIHLLNGEERIAFQISADGYSLPINVSPADKNI